MYTSGLNSVMLLNNILCEFQDMINVHLKGMCAIVSPVATILTNGIVLTLVRAVVSTRLSPNSNAVLGLKLHCDRVQTHCMLSGHFIFHAEPVPIYWSTRPSCDTARYNLSKSLMSD